jgi:hypothetical protein
VVWTGLIWRRIGTSGRLLLTWYWTFGFHEMLENSWVVEWLVTSQGLSSMELISYL